MPITGVYFIPSNPNASTVLATVTERLHTALADEPTLVGRWFLEHKLMRDTPSCLTASASSQQRQAQPRYMQFLSLSYHANHGFIYTSEPTSNSAPSSSQASSSSSPAAQPAGPMVMTTVPLASSNALFHHFGYACQPFWCHRHTVTVPGGAVYDVGDFRVRVGDVRQTQPTARVRGTVVEIEWRGPSLVGSIAAQTLVRKMKASSPVVAADGGDLDDAGMDMGGFFPEAVEEADVDAEYAASAALIREFWARLGIEGAREAILVPDVGKEVKEQLRQLKGERPQPVSDEKRELQMDEDPDPAAGVDSARQYMEIFRFNR
ncbi:uncharacterized protein BO97DRAFT_475650 [Aspergillus homomorphus CBS 101889]|uniref:Mediator of RNA polymerase II transcription subunit 20 n=1 Tax=Aspergillus homomorphus (strain CBS 101889) TaxID=1450537 RepID=A0A395I7M5_ASPHC|nr:hypothetical protein BO97DRAFT_475650 [Aspergillus homomorphus CBS 101889]RAL16111.1 hypothetical protein BO97DRAFT_475650 [Aspergillus homomorphus CBS 101889]